MTVEDMPRKELENKYNKLRRQHNALVNAVDKMQENEKAMASQIVGLESQLENANKFVQIQKQITADNIAQTQEEKDNLVAEVEALRTEMKRRSQEG